jgi:hypothetical protein
MHVPGFETGRALFHEKAANLFVFAFRPHDGNIGDGAAGDPHFFAVEHVLAAFFHGAGQHAAGIRAELRLGEAETADGGALLQLREPLVFLRVAAVGVDRIHYEGALHGDEAAQPGIAAL